MYFSVWTGNLTDGFLQQNIEILQQYTSMLDMLTSSFYVNIYWYLLYTNVNITKSSYSYILTFIVNLISGMVVHFTQVVTMTNWNVAARHNNFLCLTAK